MPDEDIVLCGASAYNKKYYLNDAFMGLPQQVQDELKAMCVLFTEDVGGILLLEYDKKGNLKFITRADDGDASYDDIGSGLRIKKIQTEQRELLEQLEMYYRVFVLGGK